MTYILEIHNPATGQWVGRVPCGDAHDVDEAVTSAQRTFARGIWASTSPNERAALIERVADLLDKHAEEIIALVSDEIGAPAASVRMMQHLPATATLRSYAQATREYPWNETRQGAFGFVQVSREPVGVVGAITAWNVPLFLVMNKLGAALAAGCSVVLKPAPQTPFSARWAADLVTEAGPPTGVLSDVPGDATTGAPLVAPPLVDNISFTGSTR